MRVIAVIAVLIFGVSTAAAQTANGRIRGTVLDSAGAPLEGVAVTLSGAGGTRTTVTGPAGLFLIDGIAPGTYRITATRERLRDAARAVTVGDGQVDVELRMQPAFSETVIVTASRTPQSLLSAPAAVTVIDARDLEVAAADTFADVLRGVPGLNITQFGARDIEVNSRASSGILSNSMLVMIDGRAFHQPLYGAVYWDLTTVTTDQISRIEVMRSPASALWGANALSGVINVLTRTPRQMQGLRGEIGIGERGTKTAAASWADATDRVSYRLSGSYFEQDAWDRDNRLPDGSPMAPTVVFTNRGTKQPKMDVRLDFDGDRSRVWSIRGGMAGANGLIHSALGPAEFESRAYYSYLEVGYTRDDLDFKVYWNRLDAPFRIVLYGLDEDSTNNTFAADVARRMQLGSSHHVTFGGSARADQFDITIAPGDTSRVDAAAFVEDRIAVGSRLSVVAGGRLDKFDTTDAVFAPRLGVVVTPTPAHSLRVTYNRAYRAPSLLENFVDITLPAVVPIDPPFFFFQRSLGNQELKMEKQDAYEIGYTGAVGARTTVFATVYHQAIRNNIWFLPVSFYGPGAPPPGWPGDPATAPVLASTFSFVNLGRVRDRGIELAARVEWPQLALQAAYTLRDVPRLESGTAFPLQINQPSRHQVNGAASFVSERWSAGADVHYAGRAFWADVFTPEFWGYTDSYLGVNARLGYRLRHLPWEAWISATDLFNARIQSHVYGDVVRRKVVAGLSWGARP